MSFQSRLLFLIVLATACLAQDFRATISGQVTDSTQAAIAGAEVRAIQDGTNQVTRTTTNSDGIYALQYLMPGKYDVEVSAPGFASLKKRGVTLLVADRIDMPLVLELGKLSDTITVTAEQETVQTGNASGGQSFDSLVTSEYPLNGRQVYMLMALSSGVLFTQEQFGSSGFSGTRGWDTNGEYVMNGGVKGTNQFLLNGAPVSLTGSWQLSPNVEAIQEFKVMTNTYDSQFGRTGGGTVNTTLKSGTNGVHGSLFEYLRNSVLDANNTQNNTDGYPRGKHITHQFGGTLGGAVRRDKDFLFGSFEGFRERVPFPVVTDTPPLDLRDGQHFSTYKIKVFDPLTNRLCTAGIDTPKGTNCFSTYIRNPFPNNAIPASRISPIGQRILDLWPSPTRPTLTQNFLAAANTGKYRYDQPMVRWDHIFSEKDRLYAIVTFQHGHEDRNQNGFPAPAQTGNIISERTNQNYIADWTCVLTPTSVLDVRLSFGRFTSYFPDGQRDFDFTAEKLGMSLPQPATAKRATAPHIILDSYSSIIGNTYTWSTQNQWNFAPSVTKVHGRHTTHIGFEYVYAGIGTGGPGRANGEFSFNRTWTQEYSTRGRDRYDGSGVADLLLGLPASGFVDWNDTYYRTWPYYAAYVQDDWKISRRVTLNLGLRYDVQVPFVERQNRVNSGFDFTAKNPLSDRILARWAELKTQYDATNPRFPYPNAPSAIYGGKLFIGDGPRRTYDMDWTDVQPRIGLAWAIRPDTVLRTGFGIYYRTATQNNVTDGFNERTNYVPSLDGGILPAAGLTGPLSLANPFPDGIVAPSGSSLGLLTNVGRSVSVDGHQRPIPRTYQYSFGLQRRLPFNLLLDASYVGSQTVHDSLVLQTDYIPLATFQQGHATPTFLDRKVANPFFGILPQASDFGKSPETTPRDLLRPLPLFNGIAMNTNPWAKYRFDSLQLRVTKRFAGNRSLAGALTLIFSYTYSKSFEANHRLNNWDLNERPIHEISNYDKPQNIAFSGVWDLPFGKGRRMLAHSGGLTKFVVSGWNFNWIFTYSSGYPVAQPNAQFSCDSYLPPGGVQTRDRWFNNSVSCYKDRPSYTLRDTPDRFAWIRNPASPQLNLTVARTFKVTEKTQLQLRGESFNATNTPLYNGPVTDFKDPRFGQLPLAQRNFPRLVQIAGKILF